MPELPEVETIRRQLAKVLIGKKIAKIRVFSKKSFVGEAGMVVGRVIKGVKRRGKILMMEFRNLSSLGRLGQMNLLIHLKLTGQLIYKLKIKKTPRLGSVSFAWQNQKSKIKIDKYTRVVIEFEDGSGLEFRDARKFGWMKAVGSIGEIGAIREMGPEPFDKTFTMDYLKKILAGSKRPVKIILMDQEKIAGIGNIYANEALFCAQIDPRTQGKELVRNRTNRSDRTNRINRIENKEGRVEKLYRCLKEVLKRGLRYQGASDQWYLDAYGEKGSMQKHFLVYGQTGKPCANKCGGMIKRVTLGGRGTFYCQKCQKSEISN